MAQAKRSRLDPEERRQQILRCARTLFTERGYEGVSIADVAATAGVTSALIHHYFGSKRQLYLAVVRAIVETARDVSTSVVDSTRPLEARVAATIDAWLSYVEREGDAWLAVTANDGAISDPEISALVEDARETCAGRMLRTYAGTLADTPTTRFVMRSFIYFNETVSRRWQAGEATREEAHTLLTQTLLAILTHIGHAVDTVDGMPAAQSREAHGEPEELDGEAPVVDRLTAAATD